MIFKDKEIIDTLRTLEKKIDMLMVMHKTDKIKRASEKSKSNIKGDEKNV